MAEGIIYILINEAMPGYTKIGKTENLRDRIRQLDSTGVPLPFECFYAAKVSDMDFTETKMHGSFEDRRVRKRREFFQVDPEQARSALEIAGGEEVTPLDDIVEDTDDQTALNKARQRRSAFNFTMVGIDPGTVLTSVSDPTLTCTVVDNRRVEFEGEEISLTAAALEIAVRRGGTRTAIQGPRYWEYNGETLDGRRQRMEEGG